MKIKTFKNGCATMERLFPSGMYLVKVNCTNGYVDKVRCDDYAMAREYWRAFCIIAKRA